MPELVVALPKVPADMDSFRADEKPTMGQAVLDQTSIAEQLLTGLLAALGLVVAGSVVVLLHQGSAGLGGTASDIKIQAERLLRMKRRMLELTAQHTGKEIERIEKDSQRDNWFTAEQAKEYGLIDEIFTTSAHAAAVEA